MKRRGLLVTLGIGGLMAPLASLAQPKSKVWRIGLLREGERSDSLDVQRIDAFKAGMRELGYAEGRDYAIENRSAGNDLARLPVLASELAALKVDLIVAPGTPAALAARNATREIPILITVVGDPVGSGLAATLARPGGNVTGLTNLTADLYTKRLDMLRQMLPGIRRVGFMYNPDNAGNALSLAQFEGDCAKLGFQSIRAPVRGANDIAAAFESLKRDKAQALIVSGGGTNITSRERIIDQAAKHRLAAVYSLPIYPESGGLISYATDPFDLFRRAAIYADKIFKGAKPGDLPIEQPIKFGTVINLKTARALGIKIPQSILMRADRVIE